VMSSSIFQQQSRQSSRVILSKQNFQNDIDGDERFFEIYSKTAALTQSARKAMSNTTLLDSSPENSARELDSAYLVLDVKTGSPLINLADSLDLDMTLSNMGKEEASTVKIDQIVPEEFELCDNTYNIDKEGVLELKLKIGHGLSKTVNLRLKAKRSGEFSWNPSLVYVDKKRNYKIARGQTIRVVVESNELNEILSMLARKQSLERELTDLEGQVNSSASEISVDTKNENFLDRIYTLKERISQIEESILRIKNGYEKLQLQLEQVRADLKALSSEAPDSAYTTKEKSDFESLEKLIVERIERRWSILEQTHLL